MLACGPVSWTPPELVELLCHRGCSDIIIVEDGALRLETYLLVVSIDNNALTVAQVSIQFRISHATTISRSSVYSIVAVAQVSLQFRISHATTISRSSVHSVVAVTQVSMQFRISQHRWKICNAQMLD